MIIHLRIQEGYFTIDTVIYGCFYVLVWTSVQRWKMGVKMMLSQTWKGELQPAYLISDNL